MTLRDILNPWGALREARADARWWQNRGRSLEVTVARLRSTVRHGHYHDPKTGRLGKRGVVPKGLQND